jgi:hypothetical protein
MVHPATRSQCARRKGRDDASSTVSELDTDLEPDLFSLVSSSVSEDGCNQQAQRTPQRTRLDDALELQLILDIDEAGGIKSAFNLAAICDKREGLFGETGSPERTKVQKRVSYWKSFPERYYFRRSELGIRTVSANKRKPPSQRVKVPVSHRRKQDPTSPSPKKLSGANPPPSEQPRRRRSGGAFEDVDDNPDKQFLLRFAELKLNMSSARFSTENDLAVDSETKDRVRGTYGMRAATPVELFAYFAILFDLSHRRRQTTTSTKSFQSILRCCRSLPSCGVALCFKLCATITTVFEALLQMGFSSTATGSRSTSWTAR